MASFLHLAIRALQNVMTFGKPYVDRVIVSLFVTHPNYSVMHVLLVSIALILIYITIV